MIQAVKSEDKDVARCMGMLDSCLNTYYTNYFQARE